MRDRNRSHSQRGDTRSATPHATKPGSEPKGKTFHTGDGEVATEISAIKWQQESGKKPAWRAKVDDFTARNFHFDSLGKNHGILVINKTGLKGLSISSSSINNLQKLAGANSSFQYAD